MRRANCGRGFVNDPLAKWLISVLPADFRISGFRLSRFRRQSVGAGVQLLGPTFLDFADGGFEWGFGPKPGPQFGVRGRPTRAEVSGAIFSSSSGFRADSRIREFFGNKQKIRKFGLRDFGNNLY